MITENREALLQTEDEPGCSAFEATLSLVDGLLAGVERAAAEAHARACAICGPMVASWSTVSGELELHFEVAAEKAKPDLALVADRVLATVSVRRRVPEPAPVSALTRIFRAIGALQPHVALAAAAAAIILAVLPLANDSANPTVVASNATPEASTVDQPGEEGDSLPPPGQLAGANDLNVRQLAFDGADGMVYRTQLDGMTVIWITEHDGA